LEDGIMKPNRFGKGMERIPNFAFRIMAAVFWVRDRFVSVDRLLDEFDIQKGQTVIDFGCGPGSYIAKASRLVGDSGKVLAVDIHELAIKAVGKRALKENLTNVTGYVAENGICPLADNTSDIIYALDMFHMVSDPGSFLTELNRISRSDGVLFIDDGHQSREESKEKIAASGSWDIVDEKIRYMKCCPRK
jgi:ubiquinone/menaquinone biosynthesis C-methylase UbiE